MDWVLVLHERPGDVALRAELEAWISGDMARRQAFREASDLWGLSGQLDPMYAHLWAPESQTGKPKAATVAASTMRRGSRRMGLGLALAASLVLALSVVFYAQFHADYRVAAGRTGHFVLEDHSEVFLNTDSALDVDYGATTRAVKLRGEAFFAVTANKSQPFVVHAGAVQVRVLGTHFNVRSRGDELRVEVEEGHVLVTQPGHDGEQLLSTGDFVMLDGTTLRRGRMQSAHVAAWRRGQLIVENWPVRKVIEEIGHYRRGVTLVTDDRLGAQMVSGVFNVAQPDDALRAATQPVGGALRTYGPYLALISAR